MRTILTAAGIFACILLAGCMQNPAAAASVVSSAPVSAVSPAAVVSAPAAPMASSAVPAPPVPEDEWVDACFYGSFNGESPPEMEIRPLKLPVGWTDAGLLNAVLRAGRKSEDVCAVEQTEKGLVVTMRQPEHVEYDASCYLYLLDEMAQTLRLHHGPDAQVFFRTEDGGPLVFKQLWVSDTIYEIPVDQPYELCVDWMAQAVAEYPWSAPQYDPADRSWADTVPQAGLAPDDAFGWEIARFLRMVLPQGYWEPETLSFDSPDQAGDAFLKRVGFRLTERLPKSDADMVYPEELQQSARLWPTYRMLYYIFVPKHHLGQAVQYVFGDGVTFEHGDFGENDKTWSFFPWPGVYMPTPAGLGDGYLGGIYSSVLGYCDLGETVEVEIAQFMAGPEDFLFDTSNGEQITVESEYDTETGKYVYDRERVLELIWTQSPRAAVTLTKKPDGGFWLTGYHYIGYV
ncbi:hypothetical protein [Anaerotruncus colihominis]|uniref:hypothetical protein n=1 Tax=Anaerotruncus colihominis TaxID=169435 RepID=UPI00242C58DB|nr:hypothetical protein [Anaerotruncus colihominis]